MLFICLRSLGFGGNPTWCRCGFSFWWTSNYFLLQLSSTFFPTSSHLSTWTRKYKTENKVKNAWCTSSKVFTLPTKSGVTDVSLCFSFDSKWCEISVHWLPLPEAVGVCSLLHLVGGARCSRVSKQRYRGRGLDEGGVQDDWQGHGWHADLQGRGQGLQNEGGLAERGGSSGRGG